MFRNAAERKVGGIFIMYSGHGSITSFPNIFGYCTDNSECAFGDLYSIFQKSDIPVVFVFNCCLVHKPGLITKASLPQHCLIATVTVPFNIAYDDPLYTKTLIEFFSDPTKNSWSLLDLFTGAHMHLHNKYKNEQALLTHTNFSPNLQFW